MDNPAKPLPESPEARLVWRRANETGALPDDPGLRSLLEDPGSLTASLRRNCGDGFELELVSEGIEAASVEDRALLGTGSGRVHVRRVSMRCGSRIWVCAGTLVPPETLAGAPWLESLGSTPLGDALEARGELRRLAFEFARADSTHPAFAPALAGADIRPAAVWARRSVFTLDAGPILVYELFLPGIGGCGRH
jgi:chorismate--pyruvate lyase